ncbi:hypothetical protein [uncultured Fibrella sp.]|uniref:hypothetical protein n=1 Tax=uncultured Fibrella sp. TaxID=1284596 RepID=UPI0035CA8D33
MEKKEDPQKVVFTWKMLLLSFSFLIGMTPILIGAFYRNSQRKAIREDQAFTTGTISKFVKTGNGKRRWYDAYADYRVNDRVYTCIGKAKSRLTEAQCNSLIGVRMPVIYEKKDPANAYLLTSTKAFNRFNFDLPDSLGWTAQYFTD